MDKEKLKLASDLTFQKALKYEIVLPSLYKSIFDEMCKEVGVEVEDNADNATTGAISKVQEFQNHIEKGTTKLQNGVDEAVKAVENKDINRLKKVKQDMIQLQEELQHLKGKLYHDELTKLYNRRWLLEKYTKDGEFQNDGILVFLDLDKFKHINDNFGHIVGDKVLEFFGKVINDCEDNSKIGIRYAGDEFIIIFEYTNIEKCQRTIVNIKKTILKKIFRVGGKEFKISFSSGYALFKKGDKFATVIELADMDMYKDKEKA